MHLDYTCILEPKDVRADRANLMSHTQTVESCMRGALAFSEATLPYERGPILHPPLTLFPSAANLLLILLPASL